MAAKEEAVAVEDMEVGLDYLLPCDKLELKTAAPKSCAEIRLSPTYLGFRVILIKRGGAGNHLLSRDFLSRLASTIVQTHLRSPSLHLYLSLSS